MNDLTMAYIGRASCGCVRSVIVETADNRSTIARETGKWIRYGLDVERMPLEQARPLIKSCPHKAAKS